MEFRPIRTKKIYEEIIEQIKTMIAEGKLRPGDKLISEREMAEKMQVGRSAVREAFRALEAMKIIKIKPGEGTYIREASSEHIIEALSLVLSAEQDTAKELMELRIILEVQSAGLAAKRRKESDLAVMKRALHQMELDVKNGEYGEKADFAFHYAIAKATKNTMVLRLMANISDTMSNVMHTARVELFRDPSRPQQLLDEHWSIYQAIADSNQQLAQKSMYDHLHNVEKSAFPR
ncbi:FadR/GntR family transcriptional regulator [Peptococcaceae bacterium 1198_IL3148]